MNETLTSGASAPLWNVTARAASEIVAKLESLGFRFAKDLFGGRKVPVELANAVSELRKARKPFETILNDPRFSVLRGGAAQTDALGLVIEARADYAIAREITASAAPP